MDSENLPGPKFMILNVDSNSVIIHRGNILYVLNES